MRLTGNVLSSVEIGSFVWLLGLFFLSKSCRSIIKALECIGSYFSNKCLNRNLKQF